jgi:Spy/CpxP family protein refolding chaperone
MTDAMTDRPSAVRRLLLGAAFAAIFAAGLVPPPAASARQQDAAAQADVSDPGGDQGGDHRGRRGGGMRARVEHMLDVAGATPDQKAKIRQILKTAFQQTAPQRRKAAETHRELGRLLTAPKIDRAAIERVRAEHVAATDQSGRILVKAFADAAEVLKPEQRAKIAGAIEAEPRHATLK